MHGSSMIIHKKVLYARRNTIYYFITFTRSSKDNWCVNELLPNSNPNSEAIVQNALISADTSADLYIVDNSIQKP